VAATAVAVDTAAEKTAGRLGGASLFLKR
jgi:hypothetical protein